MRFVVDTNLPRALSALIVSKGHESEHVLDIGLGQADDREIWVYAEANGAVVVSKDDRSVTPDERAAIVREVEARYPGMQAFRRSTTWWGETSMRLQRSCPGPHRPSRRANGADTNERLFVLISARLSGGDDILLVQRAQADMGCRLDGQQIDPRDASCMRVICADGLGRPRSAI